MTRIRPAIAATPDAKKRVDSTSSHRSTPDASFSIQLDAARPTVTRARTPHEVTKSVWKPLTQPALLSEDLKRASTPATNPTAKRSRVTNSQAAKDSASKANRNVRSGMFHRLCVLILISHIVFLVLISFIMIQVKRTEMKNVLVRVINRMVLSSHLHQRSCRVARVLLM